MIGIKTKVNVVAAIIINDGRVLATQRGYGEFKGYWEFPGGKIEQGETAHQALKREIEEELEVEIDVKELFDIVEFDYPDFHLFMQCFLCVMKQKVFTLKEHSDAKWLSREYLGTVDWLPADRSLIEQIKMMLYNT